MPEVNIPASTNVYQKHAVVLYLSVSFLKKNSTAERVNDVSIVLLTFVVDRNYPKITQTTFVNFPTDLLLIFGLLYGQAIELT